MDSLNSTTDAQQCNEQPHTSSKSKLAEKKSKRVRSLNKTHLKRKLRPWKHWLAQTARIKYTLPPTDPEESSYYLKNLFHISSDILGPIASRQQSFNVNIFNMPSAQKATIEEQLKSEVSSTIKVEILNMTAKQETELKAFPKSEVIVISDSESDMERSSLENKKKIVPVIDKGFYQKTTTSIPAKYLPKDEGKIVHSVSQPSSKIEVINWPPLQKAKTEEYLKSQTTSCVKAEVLNPTPRQKAVVKSIEKGSEQAVEEIEEKSFKNVVSKSCETGSNNSNNQNITVKIYHNSTETNLKGQSSNIFKFEIITAPQEKCISTEDKFISGIQNLKQDAENSAISKSKNYSAPYCKLPNTNLSNTLTKEETKSPNKLKIEVPHSNNSQIDKLFMNQSSETEYDKPETTKKPLTFKQIAKEIRKLGTLPMQTIKNPKIITNDTMPQISSATVKSLTSKSSFLTLRQRQMELHRLRVQVEEKRLELLDLKLAREWQELKRSKVELDKNLKTKRFEVLTLDDDVDV